MKEIKMSLREIQKNFGDDIASKCDKMEDGDIKFFSTTTYGGIRVRCERFIFSTYYVQGETILETALEFDELEEGMGIGM
jgi:hypothetical protein